MARPRVTHCKRGHAYTPENTVMNRFGKRCLSCKNADARIRYYFCEELRLRIQRNNIARKARPVEQPSAGGIAGIT